MQWYHTFKGLLCLQWYYSFKDCCVLMTEPVNNLKSRELSHLMVEVNALGSLDEVSYCPAQQQSRRVVCAVLVAMSDCMVIKAVF